MARLAMEYQLPPVTLSLPKSTKVVIIAGKTLPHPHGKVGLVNVPHAYPLVGPGGDIDYRQAYPLKLGI